MSLDEKEPWHDDARSLFLVIRGWAVERGRSSPDVVKLLRFIVSVLDLRSDRPPGDNFENLN